MDRIPLGSGDFYMLEWQDSYKTSFPEDATIETTGNLLGEIKNGGECNYTKEVFTDQSDNGKASRTKTTKEAVVIKCGVMTVNKNTWQRFIDSARVTDTSGVRTIKIGGTDNETNKKYICRFVQRDPEYGDLRFTIVGMNTVGFTFGAKNDATTVLNGEFTAEPLLDDEGTLLIIIEEIPQEEVPQE